MDLLKKHPMVICPLNTVKMRRIGFLVSFFFLVTLLSPAESVDVVEVPSHFIANISDTVKHSLNDFKDHFKSGFESLLSHLKGQNAPVIMLKSSNLESLVSNLTEEISTAIEKSLFETPSGKILEAINSLDKTYSDLHRKTFQYTRHQLNLVHARLGVKTGTEEKKEPRKLDVSI